MEDKWVFPSIIKQKALLLQVLKKNIEVEMRGIDPRTSRMLSERSTIWATSPCWDVPFFLYICSLLYLVFFPVFGWDGMACTADEEI